MKLLDWFKKSGESPKASPAMYVFVAEHYDSVFAMSMTQPQL